MKKKWSLLAVIVLVVVQSSCKRDLPKNSDDAGLKGNEHFSLSPGLTEDETNLIWDKSVHQVASTVAQLLNGKNFREYLKIKSLESFDGDYDVLLSTIVNDIEESQHTATPLVTSENYITPDQFGGLKESADDFPQMQISVQVDPETWHTDSYTPAVVYTNSDYDEHFTSHVPVVDAKGSIVSYMDATVDPVDPVVIVSMNERTKIVDGKVVVRQDPRPYGVEGTEKVDSLGPINPGAPVQWYRQNFKYETIYSIGFWELGQIEGFPAGGPELRTFYYFAADSSSTTYSRGGAYVGETWAKRKDVKDKWYNLPNEKLITAHLWDWGHTGTTFRYAFYEFDSNPFNTQAVDSIASFLTKFAKLDSNGSLVNPAQYAAYALQLIGLFLPRENKQSEFLGDGIIISANNNSEEFHVPTGGFGFRSKPY
jgi:hypothetical protein